jgi:uncharacterized membrane protein
MVWLMHTSAYTAPTSSVATYTFQLVVYPGARSTSARSINNQRDIVGTYDDDLRGPVHAFLFHDGSYFNIDVPGAFSSWATGINNAGDIVGYYITVDPQNCGRNCGAHAFLRESDEHYTTIEPPGAPASAAFAINSRGQIVGDYEAGGGLEHFLFDKGEFTIISGPTGNLLGLNSRGEMLFDNVLVDQRGAVTVLALPGASNTRGLSINDSGQVAGFYVSDAFYGYIYSRGIFETVMFPGAQQTELVGINDRGDVVGFKDFFTAFVATRE